jgi:molybdopterin converting factor small subunit
MKVSVLFFGATASEIGRRKIELDLDQPTTTRSCFDELLRTYPQLTRHKLLFSRNQEYATGDELLMDGDELAVFTAVSGG